MNSQKLFKLIFNVPTSHADHVRKAIGDAGAGQVGNYSHCTFSVKGTGRFLPNSLANPHIGRPGHYEEVGFEIYEQLNWKEIVGK